MYQLKRSISWPVVHVVSCVCGIMSYGVHYSVLVVAKSDIVVGITAMYSSLIMDDAICSISCCSPCVTLHDDIISCFSLTVWTCIHSGGM